MLTRVEVRTRRGTLLNLPLEDVSNGYILSSVEGLDPVKATLTSSSFANKDGAQYQSARREPRNIKLNLDFEPDYLTTTVESLRRKLYSFLMPKSEVDLVFIHDDGLEVEISGRVESNDAPIFTKDPEVGVSLMCFEPDFIDPNPVTISETSTEQENVILVDYIGTVETGFEFNMTLNRDESSFTIYLRKPDGTLQQLDFAAPMLSGDEIRISTVSGEKGAWLTRIGVESSVLYAIPPQSGWPVFEEGVNELRVYATGTALPYTITYTTRYGGL